VQQRIREAGAELWDWLGRGAHFYVCGDARRMAGDVEQAVRDVAGAHGGLSADAAAAFVVRLKAEGRYRADVY
jgi:sulfite reductase (NADPH) flavoprotein alpha-component